MLLLKQQKIFLSYPSTDGAIVELDDDIADNRIYGNFYLF